MAINFPTSLDSLTNPLSTDYQDSPSHSTQHANANDILEALEAKVGVDSSAVTTTHDYKLSGVTGTDKAVSKTGTETLTNKTLTSPKINENVALTSTATELNLLDGLTSLVSGWLDAGETWTYASADDPTFTFTIAGVDLTTKYSPGMRIKLTQTTVKYFIITKVAFSTDTTITVYGGTDYDLADAAITLPYFSTQKAPVGFPLDPLKWTVETRNTSANSQTTPSASTWYNMGSITISVPIGSWRVFYMTGLEFNDTSTSYYVFKSTLSTANNSESDVDFSAYLTCYFQTAGGQHFSREKYLLLAAKTSYYLNYLTTSSGVDWMGTKGDQTPTIIRAVCAYL